MRILIHKSFILLSVLILLCTTSPLFAGDTVLDLMEQAKNEYQEENYKLAHDLLQKALGKINKKISTSFKPFLPEPPAGWIAENFESQSVSHTSSAGNIRITEAERRYIRQSDKKAVKIMITNTPEILEPYHQMSKVMESYSMKSMMETMMKERGILRTEQKGGWYIFIEQESPKNYKLSAVHEQVVVVIEDAESDKMAEKFLERIDLTELAAAAKE